MMQALGWLPIYTAPALKPYYYKIIIVPFIDKETEVRSSHAPCPDSPSPGVAESGVDPCLSHFPGFALVTPPWLPDIFVAVYQD